LDFELFFFEPLGVLSGTRVVVEGLALISEGTIVEDETKDAASDELE